MRLARLTLSLVVGCTLTWLVVASQRDLGPAKGACEFHFHHDHIIGTSLDIWVTAPDEAVAEQAERAILDEIERLRRIFSTYDPESELSRLNRTREPMAVSGDMIAVLRQYEAWQFRSDGAFSGQLGELVRVWKDAEKSQCEPDSATLSRIVKQVRGPGWRIDEPTRTVTRLTDQALNLNSIAKGYIIQKAAAAAREKSPALQSLLVNLGGDMAARGNEEVIGMQDPHHSEDNAMPFAIVRVKDCAVATSGGYERYYTIDGKRHSHIFDLRTGRSANGAASATVIAPDNVTANALATTLCVLTPEEGLRLVAATPGAECLLITKDGQVRSPGFAAFEVPVAVQDKDKKEKPRPADAWPVGHQVSMTINIPNVAAMRYRRPYVAVWVENADAKPVRTVTVWGNNPKWIKDLPQWWKFAKNDSALVKAVTRAMCPPGKYTVVWDGKDDKGDWLPRGTYTVFVEVHREHGKLVRQTGKLNCGTEPASIKLEKNVETGETVIEYAKKKAP